MGRPSLAKEKRAAWLPVIARAFADLGYRGTTTAELAKRLGVQENLLYRIWADKRAMFIASIDFVYESSAATWRRLRAAPDNHSPAERLLAHEAQHHGEFGLYRILFAGLNETNDPEIGAALRRMFQSFVRFLTEEVEEHWRATGNTVARSNKPGTSAAGARAVAERIAWAFVGLGMMANMSREIGLFDSAAQAALFMEIGGRLLRTDAVASKHRPAKRG